MTVSVATPIDRYTGDGSTVAFSFSYEVFDLADVVVTLYNDSDVDKTGTKDGSGTYDYTVTGSLSSTTNRYTSVTVTFNTAPPSGWLLSLTRAQDQEQDTNLTNGGAFNEKSLEFQLDKLVHMVQDLQERVDRANLENPAIQKHTSDMTFDGSAKVTGLPDSGSGSDAVNFNALVSNLAGFATADADTVATLAALQALTPSNNDLAIMLGRSSAADGGGGVFAFDSSNLSTEVGNDEVTSSDGNGGVYIAPSSDKTGASGAWVRLRYDDRAYNVRWYGATGNADDSTGFQAAFDAAGGNSRIIIPPASYTVAGPITVSSGRVNVTAYGAIIVNTEDDVLFEYADGKSDATYDSDGWNRGHTWLGGQIRNNNVNKTSSVAFRLPMTSRFTMRDVEFGSSNPSSADGHYITFQLATCEVLLLEQIAFWKATIHLNVEDLSTSNRATVLAKFLSCDFRHEGAAGSGTVSRWINVQSRIVDWHFDTCSFSYGSGDHTNETKSLFRTKAVGTNPSFTAPSRNIKFENCKMESAPGVTLSGTTGFFFDNVSGTHEFTGLAFTNFRLIGQNTDAANDNIGLRFEKCNAVFLENVTTAWNTGNGDLWQFDSQCTDVRINAIQNDGGSPANFAAGDAVYSLDRDELTLFPSVRNPGVDSDISGFSGNSFSTGSGTIDMSANWGEFPTDGIPKWYDLAVVARDSGSGSAVASGSLVEVYRNTQSGNRRIRLSLAGAPDNNKVGAFARVYADSNGDVNYNIVATGAFTLDLWITVLDYGM